MTNNHVEEALEIIKEMKIGDTAELLVPNSMIDRVRTRAQRLGRFSFKSISEGVWQARRRSPKEQTARTRVRLALAKYVHPIVLPADIPINSARQYITQWNMQFNTAFQWAQKPEGVEISRDYAAEACAGFIAAANSADHSADPATRLQRLADGFEKVKGFFESEVKRLTS